jgi:hypothetical protein
MFNKILITTLLISFANCVMAYEIHISKTKEWNESQKAPIKPNELLEIINLDPELISEGQGVEGKNPGTGEVINVNTDLSFKYLNKITKQEYYYHLVGSHVRFKYIDENQIQKAKEIASKLKAYVQGDEGEYY